MKNMIRNIAAAILLSPFLVTVYLTSIFAGKEKAIAFFGPFVTSLAKQSLRFWVPKIETANDFDRFPSRMKANFYLWRPFYDIELAEETDDTFKLNVRNCPFCEVLNNSGLSGLSPYVCKGDWQIADENKDKWIFERKHQIGTGDSFCDHTYKRKK